MEAITSWLDATRAAPNSCGCWSRSAAPFACSRMASRCSSRAPRTRSDAALRKYDACGAGRARRARSISIGSSVRWRATSCRRRPRERDSAQTRLIQAGFRSPQALRNFYGIKGRSRVVAAARRARRRALAAAAVDEHRSVFCAVLARLHRRASARSRARARCAQRRIKRLRNGLPDALDLLVVCVESGLGLAPAIERVARELEFSHPDLAQELSLVNAEMRAGVERPVALRNLANRSGVDDINGLVGLLGSNNPLRHERRRSPARLLRGVSRQAHAKGRGASGEDRHEDDLPARAVPVPVIFHRRHRTGSIAHHRSVQADVSRAALHGGTIRCRPSNVAA